MIYDYQCQDCNQTFEVRATLAEKEAGLQPQCQSCGSKRTRQLMRGFAIGSGSQSANPAAMPSSCGPNLKTGCC